MQNAWIVFNQVLVMAGMALIGFALVKAGKLRAEATLGFSNILIYTVTPAIIIGSMQRAYGAQEARLFLLALILSAGVYGMNILIVQFAVRRTGHAGVQNPNAGLERFACVLPNAGYIGIPLVQAVLGADGVFFLTAYLVCFNLVMFSYGRYQLTKDGETRGIVAAARPFSPESLRRSFINPATISVIIGGTLYLCGLRLPAVLKSVTDGFMGINSVISMILIGIFLSQTDFRTLLHFSRGMVICLARLVLLPLLVILLLAVLDVSWFTANDMLVKTTVVIASCTPVSAATSFMSELCGADSLQGTKLVVVSTLLSIVTMPLMLLLWESVSAIF